MGHVTQHRLDAQVAAACRRSRSRRCVDGQGHTARGYQAPALQNGFLAVFAQARDLQAAFYQAVQGSGARLDLVPLPEEHRPRPSALRPTCATTSHDRGSGSSLNLRNAKSKESPRPLPTAAVSSWTGDGPARRPSGASMPSPRAAPDDAGQRPLRIRELNGHPPADSRYARPAPTATVNRCWLAPRSPQALRERAGATEALTRAKALRSWALRSSWRAMLPHTRSHSA
jgi:hypothetical protein